VERDAARALRSQGLTMPAIAERLGVSRSSVSLWTRDVPFQPPTRPDRRAWTPDRRPSALHLRKLAEIEQLQSWGREEVGSLSRRELLLCGAMLYAGEGGKRDGCVKLANNDWRLVAFFCTWLRQCFDIDEHRLRAQLYLREGLDLEAAEQFWSRATSIPRSNFGVAYRAVPDATIRHSKHVHGCCTVRYSCSHTHRAVMGVIAALVDADPG